MKNFERKIYVSIERLQSFGRLFFTRRQLFYEFCRTLHAPFNFRALNMLLRTPQTIPPPVSRDEFAECLTAFLQNQSIEGLLGLDENITFTPLKADDLRLYGLPNLLVCDSDEIARMLRFNQFHLQTPCAVLSLKEAVPLSENFQQMLSNAEKPQVFFVHEASAAAYAQMPALRKNLALDESIPLKILGLRPVHAQRLHLFAEKISSNFGDFGQFDFLDDSEKRWLAEGNSAEISAISPVRLLRVLRRLILGTPTPPSAWQINLPDKNLGFM